MSPRVHVVLQARMDSSRLPAKTLLPIAGIPAAVLSAKRVKDGGLDVVAAVADEPLAHLLLGAFACATVPAKLGPADDVLARFAVAIADSPDDAIVVRLTADNPVPDAALVREVADVVESSGDVFCTIPWPQAGLPYGVAVEAFRAGSLRRAAAAASEPYDREHVTPWLARALPVVEVCPALGDASDLAALRCTLDTFDDYERLVSLFSFEGAATASWRELVHRLRSLGPAHLVPQCLEDDLPSSRIVLGTAQLGSAYGIANRSREPEDLEATQVVRSALAQGITVFDTAPAYGQAESRLGVALSGAFSGRGRIVTKLDAQVRAADRQTARDAVDSSVFRSLAMLRRNALDTLLLHTWEHRAAYGGAMWERLLELQRDGYIGRLGASVVSPSEALAALADPDVRHVQLPLNVLDDRWERAGISEAAAARSDVTVHVRSVFLQGLLVSSPDVWPRIEGIDADALTRHLRRATREGGFRSAAELCLSYVLTRPWVDAAVVGVDNTKQLGEIADMADRCWRTSGIDWDQLLSPFGCQPDKLLDPWRWPSVETMR
jgi:aryl-alcohol dehydrogenase-like predicted oxidoreductase/spore coat polysaccharide biosynthesis protein SpsF (cytidylyltransferase family)